MQHRTFGISFFQQFLKEFLRQVQSFLLPRIPGGDDGAEIEKDTGGVGAVGDVYIDLSGVFLGLQFGKQRLEFGELR